MAEDSLEAVFHVGTRDLTDPVVRPADGRLPSAGRVEAGRRLRDTVVVHDGWRAT